MYTVYIYANSISLLMVSVGNLDIVCWIKSYNEACIMGHKTKNPTYLSWNKMSPMLVITH